MLPSKRVHYYILVAILFAVDACLLTDTAKLKSAAMRLGEEEREWARLRLRSTCCCLLKVDATSEFVGRLPMPVV